MGGRTHAFARVCWILVWTNAQVKGYREYGGDASRAGRGYGTVEYGVTHRSRRT